MGSQHLGLYGVGVVDSQKDFAWIMQGLSDVEVEEAALQAGEEISANGYVSKPSQDSSVNRCDFFCHMVIGCIHMQVG